MLLVLGALSAACGGTEDDGGGVGGGGVLTMEEYVAEIEAFDADGTERIDLLEVEYPEAFDDPDQTLEFLQETADVIRDGLAVIEDLSPPMEIEGAHEDYVESAAALAATFEDYAERLGGDSPPDMGEVLDGLEEASERVEISCTVLEVIANSPGSNAGLDC